MVATNTPITSLTAMDLMTRDLIFLRPDMPLRDAARLLWRERITGAPVVDERGKCVGVLSAADFLRWMLNETRRSAEARQPLTCSFLRRLSASDYYACSVLPNVCPFQRVQPGPDGAAMIRCSQPHCVPTDWQLVNQEKVPTEAVSQFMTVDPVTVRPNTSIQAVAQLMLDAHIHRVIVVDEGTRPVGIVSSTDIIAAVARLSAGRA